MAFSSMMGACKMASLLVAAAGWAGSVTAAFDVGLCATLNTASMDKNVSMYQTNGLCHDFCGPQGYAYGVTQSNNCWCSNYTPAQSSQVSKSKCNTDCPGYPSEKCGGAGLFAYVVVIGVAPSGTKGAGDGSSSTSIPDSSSTTPSVSSASSVSSTSSSSSSTTERPTSKIQTVTADGTIKTVTIIPTETGRAVGDNQTITVHDNGLQTGAVVGIVVGVVIGVLLIAGAIMFFYFKRKKQQQQEDYQDDPSIRGSSSGMMGSSRPEMSRAPGSPGSTGNRSGNLQVDPRMDPFQQSLYARNGSRESIGTLRDDHDYSRRIQQPKVLRATNPDPDVD